MSQFRPPYCFRSPASVHGAMRLLTHNQLMCIVKGCAEGFPLRIEAESVEREESEPSAEFILGVMPRVDLNALAAAATQLGVALPPPGDMPPPTQLDAERHADLLRALHAALLDVSPLAASRERALSPAVPSLTPPAHRTARRFTSSRAPSSAPSASGGTRSSAASRTCGCRRTRCSCVKLPFDRRSCARRTSAARHTARLQQASPRASLRRRGPSSGGDPPFTPLMSHPQRSRKKKSCRSDGSRAQHRPRARERAAVCVVCRCCAART